MRDDGLEKMNAVQLPSLQGYTTTAKAAVDAIKDDNPGSTVRKVDPDWIVEHPTRLVIRWPKIEASVAGWITPFEERHRSDIRLGFKGTVEEAEWVAEVERPD